MSVGRNARTIVEAIVNLSTWNGVALRLYGKPPTAEDIAGMMRPAYQLTARPVATILVKGGAHKCGGTYIGITPGKSTELPRMEKLEELVPGLRIFFLGRDRDEFTVSELEVATPAEVQQAHARAAQAAREREKENELKNKLHAHYDQLVGALSTLSGRQRYELPRCDGACNRYEKPCKYSMEKIIELCDAAGIDITTVMMEAVTRVS